MSNYTIFPLGDSAACIDLGNNINPSVNKKILALQTWLQHNSFIGIKDIIVAYSSLAVLYDPFIVKRHYSPANVFEYVKSKINEGLKHAEAKQERTRQIKIPVCYDEAFGTDLGYVEKQKNLSKEEIIALHTSRIYRVYMIGFLPGFPYMAEVDEKIVVPRKDKPAPVTAGSIGIAGKQTGIYPLNSPGGWQIIGKTPIRVFDPEADPPVKIVSGDLVEFYPITNKEMKELNRLPNNSL